MRDRLFGLLLRLGIRGRRGRRFGSRIVGRGHFRGGRRVGTHCLDQIHPRLCHRRGLREFKRQIGLDPETEGTDLEHVPVAQHADIDRRAR